MTNKELKYRLYKLSLDYEKLSYNQQKTAEKYMLFGIRKLMNDSKWPWSFGKKLKFIKDLGLLYTREADRILKM